MAPPCKLVACTSCNCHARLEEAECPRCGARMRGVDGVLPRAAAALLIGLTALSGSIEAQPAYGGPPTGGGPSGTGGQSAQGGAGGQGGAGN